MPDSETALALILSLIQQDPHQWSTRPCSTCSAVTVASGIHFGCVAYAASHPAKARILVSTETVAGTPVVIDDVAPADRVEIHRTTYWDLS